MFPIVYSLVVLFATYVGFKMGRGEPIVTIPKKMGKSVKSEAQQAEIQRKQMEEKDVRKAVGEI